MISTPWLEDLFDDVPGFVEVRSIPANPSAENRPTTRYANNVEGAAAHVERSDATKGRNTYIGMATRLVSKDGGTKDNLRACRVLWIDYDFGPKHTRETFNEKLDGFQLRPSWVIQSGGGIHAYWLLEEPVDLRGGEASDGVQWLQATVKGLELYFESDPRVWDASRIMRVPGTMNWPDAKKEAKGRTPARSEVLMQNQHTYEADDFDPFTLRGRAWFAEREKGEQVEAPEAGSMPESVRAVLESDRVARGLFAHQEGALPRNRPNKDDVSASVFDYHLMVALLKHPSLSRDDIVKAALEARRRIGADLKLNRRDDYWGRTFDRAAKGQSRDQLVEPKRDQDSAAWFRYMLRAREGSGKGITRDGYEHSDREPGWPFGIPEIDKVVRGAYGMCSVAGGKGAGKSTLVTNSSILASMEYEDACNMGLVNLRGDDDLARELFGWTVVYFNAENSRAIVNQRIQKFFNKPVGVIEKALTRWNRFWVPMAGATFEQLREFTCACITPETRKLLVCFDSVNTVVDKLVDDGGQNYWEVMKDLLMWAQDSRVESDGKVGFMLCSELNRDGDPKGAKLEYSADVCLRIRFKKKSRNHEIEVDKSRATARPESYEYSIDPSRHRFVRSMLVDGTEGNHGSAPSQDDEDVPELEPLFTRH